MTRGLKIAAFAAVIAAQLAVPGWMLGKREWVLRNGAEYKFRAAPVDPYDPFRGRYVALSFEDLTAESAAPNPIRSYPRPMYATLAVDENGFATFEKAAQAPPESGDFIRIDQWYPDAEGLVRLAPPFDRYYMNEIAAPEAERVYREHSNVKTRDAYVTVRVWKGYAVLDGLFVAGQPIEEFLAQAR